MPLRAGLLTMRFEPETVFLRRICFGQSEVLRGIYAAVRDRNWGTVPPRIQDLDAQVEEAHFALRFAVECRQGPIHFRWQGEIKGTDDGAVTFAFDGEALTTFERNRVGFCVLHPIKECRGAAARYQTVSGQEVSLRFPKAIEPQVFGRSPFRDMRSLAHEFSAGHWARLDFEGDTFEMEDQRNWTDASFKTYCTPLEVPFPVTVPAGTRIRQKVALRLLNPVPVPAASPVSVSQATAISRASAAEEPTTEVWISVPEKPTSSLPSLGLNVRSFPHPGTAAEGLGLSGREVECLKLLRLDQLRTDLRLGRADWAEVLARSSEQARQLSAQLELAVHLPREGDLVGLAQLASRLAEESHPVCRLMVFREGEPATSPATLSLARERFRNCRFPIGGGADSHFCELNREQHLGRFDAANAEFLAWPITPQVHAFDDQSILETIEAQPDTARTARSFAAGRPMVISPITLKPRFNAVATGAESVDAHSLPPNVDVRQMGLLTAVWTLGTVAALGEQGVQSLTFFETTGWRGVMESDAGSPLPGLFPSAPGMLFPVYHVFAALAGFPRFTRFHDAPESLIAVCLFSPSGARRLVLADATDKGVRVRFQQPVPTPGVVVLEERTEPAFRFDPDAFLSANQPTRENELATVDLAPYSVVCIDLAGR
jgi:hypothetical protein